MCKNFLVKTDAQKRVQHVTPYDFLNRSPPYSFRYPLLTLCIRKFAN